MVLESTCSFCRLCLDVLIWNFTYNFEETNSPDSWDTTRMIYTSNLNGPKKHIPGKYYLRLPSRYSRAGTKDVRIELSIGPAGLSGAQEMNNDGEIEGGKQETRAVQNTHVNPGNAY